MKKNLLKSFLIGVCLVAGVNAAWAEEFTFSPTQTTIIDKANGDVVQYDATATEWLCNMSAISNKAFNGSKTNSKIALTKFETSEKLSGMIVTKATLTFYSICTASGKNSQVNTAHINTGWDATTATWNNTNSASVLNAVIVGTGPYIKSSGGTVTHDVTELLTNSADGTLGFAIFTSTAREQKLSDFVLTVEAVDASKTANYTINYKEGENIISSTTGSYVIGLNVTAETVVYDSENNRYLIEAETAPTLTLTENETTNILNVPVRKPYTGTLNVTTTIAGNNSTETLTFTELDDKTNPWTYAYPLYVEQEGAYYIVDTPESFVLSDSFTGTETVDKTITYTNKEDDVVYFADCEIAYNTTSASYPVHEYTTFSNGKGRAIQRTNSTMKFNFTVDKAGTYSITMPYHNGSDKDRTHLISIDEGAEESTKVSINSGGVFTKELVLAPGEHTIIIKCYYSLTAAFDYLLVKYVSDEGSTLTASVTDAGFATFCPAYSVDFSNATNIEAYTASVDEANSVVNLTKVTTVAAGEGVLLKSVAGGAATEALPVIASVAANEGNALVGTLVDITIAQTDGTNTNYVLSKEDDNVGFYLAKANGTTTMKAGQAYLQVATASAANFFSILWGGEDDGATGINSIEQAPAADGIYYNLQGQRVEKPAKGLYIVNGKKCIIK